MGKLLGSLALVLAALFVLVLLLPDDEEPADPPQSSAVQTEQLSAMSFPEDMVREKQTVLRGGGEDTVTVLIYMNGSDLESDGAGATADLCEMLEADISDQVNVLVETLGTRRWSKKLGIAADRSQRYRAADGKLTLVDDSLGQLDATAPETLTDFIRWGAANYPADRYFLLFWDHGAGPVYGFGYDEHQPEDAELTVDEIQTAVKDGGVYFDVIGMDCCIMSSLELCCALYNYCDYMILSEDFESQYGWEYTGWLNALSENTSIPTPELGRILVDDMVEDNERRDGGSSTLALIDESYMKVLYTAWVDFAYANEDALLGKNYSMPVRGGRRAHPRLRMVRDASSMADYYITDIMAVAQNIASPEAEALSAAVSLAVNYFNCSYDEIGMTGLSVTLPYGDEDFYDALTRVFTGAGLDGDYVTWLGKFTDGCDSYYDYDPWYEEDWQGWDDYEDDFDWLDWLFFDDEDYWEDDDWDDWDCWEYDWDDGCYA